jgi:hypothetical protein
MVRRLRASALGLPVTQQSVPTCRRTSPARRMCKLAPAGWWHGRGAAPVTG